MLSNRSLLLSKPPYRLTFQQTEMLPPPEYIQAEAFLEVSGYFTPSSKRISVSTRRKRSSANI